jgi:hypothetical protein
MRSPAGPANVSTVTATTLLTALIALALALMLGNSYGGSVYECPICGAKRDDQHAGECPWKPSS